MRVVSIWVILALILTMSLYVRKAEAQPAPINPGETPISSDVASLEE